MSELRFEWDPEKAELNRRKHRVTFDEAASAFDDLMLFVRYDQQHSESEERRKALGVSDRGRLLSVIYTRRHRSLRIISARKANAAETQAYFENQG